MDFLQERRLRDLIKKHSEYISYPIHLLVEKNIEIEGTSEVCLRAEAEGSGVGSSRSSGKAGIVSEWELINKQKPIWLRSPDEVSREEYVAFYKSLSNDWEDHLSHKHFAVEGQIELKSILFVPR